MGGLWTCLLKEFSNILRQMHMREDSWIVCKVDLGRFVGLQRRSARGSASHEATTEETDHLIELRLRLEMLGEYVGGIHLTRNFQQAKLS